MTTVATDQSSCSSALVDLYEYVLDERSSIHSESELTVGDVLALIHEEGICFWTDGRFEASQRVALNLLSVMDGMGEVANNNMGKDGDSSTVEKKKKEQHVITISAACVVDVDKQEQHEQVSAIPLDFDIFCKLVSPVAHLFRKAFSEEFVVPDWSSFAADMTYHFYKVQDNCEGQTAQYIPILQHADPNKWALSICSIDGQRFSIGDTNVAFSIQSVSKPVTYAECLAHEGEKMVEEWIGVEPAGRPFNTQDLDSETQCPFNASVNSGAIMAAGLFASRFPEATWRECVDKIRDTWRRLSGGNADRNGEIGFSNETFQSEKATAYNNFAISYNLKGRRGLPRDVSLHKMLDVYLGCCSIEMTVEALSVAAATLANGGVCPITFKEVFPASVVRHVLAETMTCGMYDGAGKFCVDVGLPAKSGVAGALMVIVPNVFGIATFSPRLNKQGNSVRGLEFCKSLVNSYSVHIFEPLRSGNTGAKIDPRVNGTKGETVGVSQFVWAYQAGDVWATRLHDIFLYTMVRTASASSQGLSDFMTNVIRSNYEIVYHAPLRDKSLRVAIDAVVLDSGSLETLQDLRGDRPIPDPFRTVILTALVSVLLAGGQINKEEEDLAVDILSFCGMDRTVALMEFDRYTQRIGHCFKTVEPCEVNVLDDRNVEEADEDGSNPSSASTETEESEVILLRREVHRLRRKVTDLTHLLHQSRQDRTHRASMRKSLVGVALMSNPS